MKSKKIIIKGGCQVKSKTLSKSRKIKAWIAVSPICEGANLYMPGNGFDVWETKEDAKAFGWEDDELVEVEIHYKKVEKQ